MKSYLVWKCLLLWSIRLLALWESYRLLTETLRLCLFLVGVQQLRSCSSTLVNQVFSILTQSTLLLLPKRIYTYINTLSLFLWLWIYIIILLQILKNCIGKYWFEHCVSIISKTVSDWTFLISHILPCNIQVWLSSVANWCHLKVRIMPIQFASI